MKPLQGATECSPRRQPWVKAVTQTIKAPKGRQTINLEQRSNVNLYRPLRGSSLFIYNCSHG